MKNNLDDIDKKDENKQEKKDIGFIFVTIVIWIFFLGTISAIFFPEILESVSFFLWFFFASPITIIASIIAFVWWVYQALFRIFDV